MDGVRFNVKWAARVATRAEKRRRCGAEGRGGEIGEGWRKVDGTRRFANTKGEPGDYDLSFVRSFQLFCPIKISIFSSSSPTRSPFAFVLLLPSDQKRIFRCPG